MTTHTPGPWTSWLGGHNTGFGPPNNNGDMVGIAFGVGPQAQTNAALIAAAPDMLAALEKAAVEIEAHWTRDDLEQDHCGMEVALDRIKAAIAKARNQGPSADQE